MHNPVGQLILARQEPAAHGFVKDESGAWCRPGAHKALAQTPAPLSKRVPLRFIEKCRENGIPLGGAEQMWEAAPNWKPRGHLLPPKDDAERELRERYAALEAEMARIAAEWQQVPATAGA
jgi:hypothetical protein